MSKEITCGTCESLIQAATGRTWRDDKEGWVTLIGNSGTTFVEKSEQHHVVSSPGSGGARKALTMLKKFSTSRVSEWFLGVVRPMVPNQQR